MFEIGSSLRQARERRGLQLADVQRETRIRARYLQALEEERFELLPGEAYVKGFLRSYADFLGLVPQLYLDEYAERFAAHDEPDLVPRATAHTARRARPRRALVALLVLAAGVGILAWRVAGSAHSSLPPAHHRTAPRPAVHVVAQAPVATAAKTRAHAPVSLQIAAVRGDCWLAVRIGSAGGRTVWTGFVRSGRTMTFGLARRLWLRVGDPSAVKVTVAGKPVANFPTRTANVVVDARGWRRA